MNKSANWFAAYIAQVAAVEREEDQRELQFYPS